MSLSRGLRHQQAANQHAAELEEFTAMLLDALEDTDVRQAVRDITRRGEKTRRAAPSAVSATGARDLKSARLAARGRTRRG